MTSSPTDVYPTTATLTFHGATNASTLACLPAASRIRSLDPFRVACAVVGVVVAVILVWIELFRVDAICLYCTAVHACSLALLGTVLWTTNTMRTADAVNA